MNKKSLFIIIGVIAVIAIAVFIFLFSKGTKKLECTSSQGSITIKYSKKKVVAYTSKNISYNLKTANETIDQIGIDAYIEQFKLWFSNNTDGTCK